MVRVLVRQIAEKWYAAALDGETFVATAVASERSKVLSLVTSDIPPGFDHRIVEDEIDRFGSEVLSMLARLEGGDENDKRFVLSRDLIDDVPRRVLEVAAAIPKGYVTTYGSIAEVSDTEARVVGRLMATNRLYPIVPCHRVVGADMRLVGYGGRQDAAALMAKLARLRVEACLRERTSIPLGTAHLQLFPVEAVVRRAEIDARHHAPDRQLPLF